MTNSRTDAGHPGHAVADAPPVHAGAAVPHDGEARDDDVRPDRAEGVVVESQPAMAVGAKFEVTTSKLGSSSKTTSTASGCFRSSVRLRLFVLQSMKNAPVSTL